MAGIFYKGFYIYALRNGKGYVIENGNGQALRRCSTIEECKRRIDWQEV